MKLPFRLGKKQDSSQFLTVDIGSDAVKVMAFQVEETEKGPLAAITGIGRQDLLHDSTRGGIIVDVDDVSKALESAVAAATNGGDPITSAIFGVSGNLSIGLMTTVRIVRGKDAPVTEKELDKIFEQLYEAAHEQVQNKLMDTTGDPTTEVQMITSSVVYTKVDGKYVEDPVGEEGQRLEIAVFTSFSPTYHLNTLQDVASSAGLDITAVGSTIYSLVKSIGYSKGSDFDGVVMDIGGDVTEVGVVFSGGIVDTRSLDVGGSHFTEELSKGLDLSFEDAEHRKYEYSYGRLPESDVLLVQGYMDTLLDTWLHGVELLFQEFTGVKTFAPNIYMAGGGSELPDIYEVVTKEPWSRSIPFKSPPEFLKLTMKDLPLVVDRTGKASTMGELSPASLSLIYLELKGYIE